MMGFANSTSAAEITKEFGNLSDPLPCRGMNRNKYFKAALNNNNKNRYADVLPYDDSRVKLSKPEDYINASIIPQENLRKRYVAAQAPLPHTFGDFWEMIWEQDIDMIIMLTRFIEKRKVKAHCYWPSQDSSISFGDISITCTGVIDECDGLTIRTFRLQKGDETKFVKHYHFLHWPDEGVPTEDNGSFMNLVEFLRQKEGTICIHCSAGIGRTGTLIAIDIIQSRIGDATLSVKDIVNELRSHRMGMVQTKEQYLFVYSVFFRLNGISQESLDLSFDSSPAPVNPLSQTNGNIIPVFH